MARISEIIVEDWLNRQGYFTVRGLKKKGREIDLLAFRPVDGDALHVEVQDSPNPQGFLGGETTKARISESVERFVRGKYHHEYVVELRKGMLPDRDPRNDWRFMLVYNKLRDQKEQEDIIRGGEPKVEPVSFSTLLRDLRTGEGLHFETDSDAANLVVLLS